MSDQYHDQYPDAEDFLDSLDIDPLDYRDIEGYDLEYDGDWHLTIHTADFDYETDFGAELPDWVWDELYYLADLYDWQVDISYEDAG